MPVDSADSNDRPDALEVLERLLRTFPPSDRDPESRAFWKLARAFARDAGAAGLTLGAAEQAIRDTVDRARPSMIPSQRTPLVERLLHTCRIWYR